MLQKKYRLSSKSKLVNASSIRAPYFLLKAAPNGLSYNRYGFVVSKKIDKRAVIRNKIKRKARKCIEDKLRNIQGGYDMLFIIKKNIVDTVQDDLRATVEKTLQAKHFLL